MNTAADATESACLGKTFRERYLQMYVHAFAVDEHPLYLPCIRELVERIHRSISPLIITENGAQHRQFLASSGRYLMQYGKMTVNEERGKTLGAGSGLLTRRRFCQITVNKKCCAECPKAAIRPTRNDADPVTAPRQAKMSAQNMKIRT